MFRLLTNGKRAPDVSTGIHCDRENFDPKTRTIKNDPVNSARLRTLEAAVQRIFKDRELTGRSLNAKVIRDIALGLRGHNEPLPTVIEGIRRYLERHEKRVAIQDLADGSMKRYRTYADILECFFTLQSGYGKDTNFNELKPALEHHLVYDYLKAKRGYSHNYALKIFQFMRSIIEYAVAEEWADRNPIRHVKIRKYHKDPVALTMADLERLRDFTFAEPHANQVRDVFLFCCYSGLAFVDVATLSRHSLTTISDVPCILKSRTKSGVQAFVPLFPEASAILDRYAQHEACRMKGLLLPVLSNPKMNKWLKIIGNTVGIKESLHTHLARKTFTMYSEELGFSLSEMAVMMGLKNVTMLEDHYYQRRREPVITRFKNIFRPDSDQQQAG
ncbi:phage integrase SAM-like domain-containing protein [Fibrella sp. HMF5335]|uniref:Phage integrase SAM-like domain-containing protein n=1 Tax=Fibrella rubiginis TaxID=2817060 RepID=A0A939GC58_9BACT|nr:site-specific integrase [Fibrella rubiginis]MBO0935083.1 phage integrase SAM-like domain-containing protein [Fibrella rubiginis]